MKFQGLLLAFVILISIFLTTPRGQISLLQARAPTVSQLKAQSAENFQFFTIPEGTFSMSVLETTVGNLATSSKENAAQPKISAQIFLVKFLNSNTTLKQLKSQNRWPIASLTKLMTALIAVEKIDLDSEIELSKKAVESEGTIGDFESGEIYKARDLLKAMLVLSSNDAAAALAESIGIDKFAMDKRAAELGMEDTNFNDPTGLSYLNQSTANDLSKLVDYIYFHHPEIFDFTKEKTISILELGKGQTKILNSVNEFSGQPNFLGGKTGFIDESKGNLISLFNDSFGRGPILIIVLGSEDRFGDTLWLLPK